jgi:site-specific recombinase XerD
MLEGGATLETVRELMGHCSVTVAERYLFTTPDAKRAALKALDFLA